MKKVLKLKSKLKLKLKFMLRFNQLTLKYYTGVAAMLVDVGQIFQGLGQISVEIYCPPIRSLWFQLVNEGKWILWWQWWWQNDDGGDGKIYDSD